MAIGFNLDSCRNLVSCICGAGSSVVSACNDSVRVLVDKINKPELERINELEHALSELSQQNDALRNELAHYKNEYELAMLCLGPLRAENDELHERLRCVPDEWSDRVAHAENMLEKLGVPHDDDTCYVVGDNGTVYHLDNLCPSMSVLNRSSPIHRSTVGAERGKRRACTRCGGISSEIASVKALFGLKSNELLVMKTEVTNEIYLSDNLL